MRSKVVTIEDYSSLFDTFCDSSLLFALFGTICYSRLSFINLQALRVFQTPIMDCTQRGKSRLCSRDKNRNCEDIKLPI